MLNKILLSFSLFLALITTNTMAARVENPTKCFEKNAGYATQDGYGIVADYVIYFNNTETTLPTKLDGNAVNCQGLLKQAIEKDFINRDDIETVLILGSADNTGAKEQNEQLSKMRADTVSRFLSDIGIKNAQCDQPSPLRCANISIGSAIQRAIGKTESNPKTRSVYLFILNKKDVCSENDKKLLETLMAANTNNQYTYDMLQTAIVNFCQDDTTQLLSSQRQYLTRLIQKAVNNIDTDFTDFKKMTHEQKIQILATSLLNTRNAFVERKSIWRNSDGRFNFTRLASDSIAGVVLGTAGGLITSHIVKKSQISKGFDKIRCKIGGQTVASYGDTFTIGIQTK